MSARILIVDDEPSILAMKAYLEGAWPPHQPRDPRGYTRLLRHSAFAHTAMRQALRPFC